MGDNTITTNDYSPKDVALGRLLVAAGQGNASKVIGAYQTELEHPENIKILEKFTVEMYLKPCAEFLGIPASSSTGLLKADLCDLIILYIESFFPIDCSACSQSYTVDIEAENSPLLSCLICHQGSHDCNEMKEKATRFIELANEIPSGCAWICSACFKKNNHSHTGRHSTSLPSAEPMGTKSVEPKKTKSTVPPELQSQRDALCVCPKYKLGTCPHGISGNRVHQDAKCQYLHPKRCKAFCRNGPQHKFGCSRGTSCLKFHPILCTGSLSSKECYNESCTSTHLKGTKRKRHHSKPRRTNPRSNNNNNSKFNKRTPPRNSSDTGTNNNMQPPPHTKPTSTTTPSELTFLVNTVQTMMQEITTLKRDMIQSGHTLPSSHHPPHPFHQTTNQHFQPAVYPPGQTPRYPPAIFNPQRPALPTQQQIPNSQPPISSHQPPPSTSQTPQPFHLSHLLSC